MDSTNEITRLDSPIDVMYLIHKALRNEANRAIKLVDNMDNGGTLQAKGGSLALHLLGKVCVESLGGATESTASRFPFRALSRAVAIRRRAFSAGTARTR